MEEIVNKVAQSGLITLDLENYYPEQEIVLFDIKDFLFMELILKEKDFRTAMQELNWEQFRDQYVSIDCTTDAIIPMWAYMLIASNLESVAKEYQFGSVATFRECIYRRNLKNINLQEFQGARVVVKGCGEKEVSPAAYVEITRLLKPVVKTIMYGEPCSTVPIFKKKA
jgi:hypothetical protein